MNEQFVYSQKNNFSGGELTPTMEGRTELSLYQNGVKKLINFIITPSGGIMRRPPTQFVYLFDNAVPKKMVTLMFSRQLSYLLVFEAHPLETKISVFVDGNLYLTTITLDFYFAVKDFSAVTFQGIAYINFGNNRPVYKFSVDPEIVEKFYEYVKETEKARAAGQLKDNENHAADFPEKDKMFIIEPLKCQIGYFKSEGDIREPKPFNKVIYDYEVDKINDELKALHDSGAAIYERFEEQLYCSMVVTFASRLWCFGADKNIHSIWASYKGDFTDFRMAYKTMLEARNPLTAFCATFSSSTFDNVLWTVPFTNELLLGTTDGIYLVKEGNREKGEFVSIHKEIEVPVSPIKPVVLGKTIFFVEGSNCKINSLFYSQEKGGFQIADITAYFEHVFSVGIKEIAGVSSPFSMIFAVLKDGSFATFTYSQDLKIMGWTQHHLGGEGQVLGISVITADNEDRLYFHVRRPISTGGYREYMEVMSTRYFSSRIFELQKAVYADCHVNIGNNWDNSVTKQLEAALNNDTAYEFRDDITKLENIIAETVQRSLRLDIAGMDVENLGHDFRYDNRQISEYEEHFDEIVNFLQTYYSDYSPLILETSGAAFAYHRIFGSIYANLENVFLNEPETLAIIENLLIDGQNLGGDIINTIENITPHWQIPEILQNNKIVEYIPNSSFSFNPEIIIKLKTFNTGLIKEIIGITTEIITAIKSVMSKRFEVSQELNEMRNSTARINRAVMLYYARQSGSNDKNRDLQSLIREFFSDKGIGFYQELLSLAHPILTPYLNGSEVKEVLDKGLNKISPEMSKEEFEEQIKTVTAEIVKGLRVKFEEHKNIELASFKRQEELTQIIRTALLEKDLGEEAQQFVLSDNFKNLVANLMHEKLADEDDNLSVASFAASVAMSEAYSEVHDEEPIALKVYTLMQRLEESLLELKRQIIDLCPLIMPNLHASLLKNILEDENSIKLEKYLLLSKRYYGVFKKMFPDIGAYELGVIGRNCTATMTQVQRPKILDIYGQSSVAIIGDEELHAITVLDSDIIKLRHPVSRLSVGFPYKSVMQTFPFIFPEEVEHMPKRDVEIGLKVFNTKGGYVEIKNADGTIEKHHINSKYLDSDALVRFTNEKKYLGVKEVTDTLATPYKSGWVYFLAGDNVATDIECSFIVDKPYPASILKIYAKAKILPNYKGLS